MAGRLRVQMLQEAAMETERRVMAVCIQPVLIGRNPVGGVEAQALEHLRGDVGTFLRRVGGDGMKRRDPGREQPEQGEFRTDLQPVQIESQHPAGIRMHRLPGTRRGMGGVLGQQRMQERGGAARKPGDEDGPLDPPFDDGGIFLLGFVQPEKVGQAAQHVETHGAAAEMREIGFPLIGAQQLFPVAR